MVACVLAYEDCPPHDTMHKTDDYPIYYDALYFPELHLSTFETLETVKAWLLAGSVCQFTMVQVDSYQFHDQQHEPDLNHVFQTDSAILSTTILTSPDPQTDKPGSWTGFKFSMCKFLANRTQFP